MSIAKKISIAVSAIVLASGVSVAAYADTLKVATVNVQQVLQQSPRVASLSKKLEAQFKDRQTKIGDAQKALQDEMDNFKKESPTMASAAKDAAQKKITSDRADLVKQVVSYQNDLQKQQGQVMQSVLADLNGVVSTIAKAQGYALVLDSQAVIFNSNPADITKDVSTQFDAKS